MKTLLILSKMRKELKLIELLQNQNNLTTENTGMYGQEQKMNNRITKY